MREITNIVLSLNREILPLELGNREILLFLLRCNVVFIAV
uniref:Uncharacterized protein n=1 Tax=Arundo donax TaxID=35708 RepID=A0A0A8ZQL4_ARUDO